jgi:hypothetical protein
MRSLLNGQRALLAVIGGVTWLALVGGFLSSYILIDGSGGSHHSSLPAYAAYNKQEQVPTSFGSLSVFRTDLTPVGDQVEVHVAMRVDNKQDGQIDAPRFEDLRLINTIGAEAKPKPGGWIGPAVLIGHTSATIDLTFLAPADMGLLWLEYRDPNGQWPLRVVVGSALDAKPAAAAATGEVRS